MTWSAVKWIAIIVMTIDHAAAVLPIQMPLLERFGIPLAVTGPIIRTMRLIGRAAFPIFAYGVAQGCVYTKNPKKYLLRLLLFALLSELPFNLAFHDSVRFAMSNVLFTLLLGALGCMAWKYFREKGKAWIALFPAAALALLAEIAHMDYGGMGVLCVVLPYSFLPDRKRSLLCLGGLMAFLYLIVTQITSFSEGIQWLLPGQSAVYPLLQVLFACTGVALLALYREKRGNVRLKWFFYAYYPAHLLILYGLRCVISM